MVKNHKKRLLTTSLVTLLPLFLGLLLWNRLPQRIPTHWNFAGEIDGWSGRPFGVFFIPLFCLAMHWFIVGCICLDPKSQNIQGKALSFSLWFCPVFSNLMMAFVYGAALGLEFDLHRALAVVLGLLYLILGGLMPKFQHNYTIGIRVPWTLDDPENWEKTHRMAGKVCVVGGLAVLMTVFTGGFYPVLIAVMVGTSLAPVAYSIYLSRK